MAESQTANQTRLLDALAAGGPFDAAGAVERIDTHISCIFLAGDYAYKAKKALDLGFLDFTRLESRRRACEEELRLNSRLAPDVYLRVASVTGTPEVPRLDGSGPVLDYVVVMRRFPQTALLSRMLADGTLTTDHVVELARLIADFHAGVPAANPDDGFGSVDAVWRRAAENLDTLPDLMPAEAERVGRLRHWSEAAMASLAHVIDRRRLEGRVRECHGDLHLENVIFWRDRMMAFDGIEFDPDLRWIDVANELAFLIMDFDDRGAPGFARQIRNDYLELTGDYQALKLLGFYQVYRALVRAKINALQATQVARDADRHGEQAASYLRLAEAYTRPHSPALILMHGVSGTGKSTLTESLVRERGFIRLRSDVVRKQLFGLAAGQSSYEAGLDIYTAEASRRTYERMQAMARIALDAGYSVVLDATFLQRAHREPFEQLARALDVPWHIVALEGDPAALRERVHERQRLAADPSEADVAVLERQLAEREPLSEAEAVHATVLRMGEVPPDWYVPLPG